MDRSFELASTTPVTRADIVSGWRAVTHERLLEHYADVSTLRADVIDRLPDVETLESMAEPFTSSLAELYVLMRLFEHALGADATRTKVPGHGTVNEVSVADGSLHVDENLLVEGVLIVPRNLAVGGQLVVEPAGIVVVGGTIETAALANSGRVAVGRNLRAMFVEMTTASSVLDVAGDLDAFLLVQYGGVTTAGRYSIGLHALVDDDASDVFVDAVIGDDGRADWNRIARAARAAEEIYLDSYTPPTPGEHPDVNIL